jgi:hypothetical protein
MVTTRNKSCKTDKAEENDKEKPVLDSGKGTKRKRKSSADQGDVDIENEPNKSRARLEAEKDKEQEDQVVEQSTPTELVACSCRHDVMKCIGILPALPIMYEFYDSDDSESDLEDHSHTVLPIVDRNANKQQGTES